MNKSYLNRGFTLIELLVVIAIIGILSSVVLASLGTARNRGKATAAKAAMTSLRSQMESDSNGGNYGTGFNIGTTGATTGLANNCTVGLFAGAQVANIRNNIISNLTAATEMVCSVDLAIATKYAVTVTLIDATGTYCVDSSGNTKSYPAIANVAALTQVQVNAGACI